MFYHILTKDPEKHVYNTYLCGPDVVEAADDIFVAFDDSLVVVVVDVIPVVEVSTNKVNNTMMN